MAIRLKNKCFWKYITFLKFKKGNILKFLNTNDMANLEELDYHDNKLKFLSMITTKILIFSCNIFGWLMSKF